MAWSRSPPLQGHHAKVQGGKQGRLRCRDASGSQEAPLGEAQGGDMAAKLATGLVAINSWKQLGNA